MPNQRDPKKTRLAIWLLPEERRALARLAKETGTNMSEVVKIALLKAKKKK
jgi:hypothetical protein